MKKYCNPKPLLKELTGEKISIIIKKYIVQYKGYLVSFDEWFNIQLTLTDEILGNISIGKIGDCFVKCSYLLMLFSSIE